MRLRSHVGWLALATTMTWGVFANAAAPDAERLKTAAEEFDAGRRAFKLKDFENAAIHFENADRDAPSPEALQSAIRGRKEAGQNARALTLCAWGLSRYPNDKAFGEYARHHRRIGAIALQGHGQLLARLLAHRRQQGDAFR